MSKREKGFLLGMMFVGTAYGLTKLKPSNVKYLEKMSKNNQNITKRNEMNS
jgi:hypothetical protein